VLDPTLQLLPLVGDDFARLCFERCCFDACGAGGRLYPLIHHFGIATVGGCLDLGAQVLPVHVSIAAGGLLGFAHSYSEGVTYVMARVLLVCQQGYPFSFHDWLHFIPMRLEPVSIFAFFAPESKHGRVVNSVAEMRPFGVRVFSCRLVSKLLLKGLGKALSLGWIGICAGVAARETLRLGMVDLSRLQPDPAGSVVFVLV